MSKEEIKKELPEGITQQMIDDACRKHGKDKLRFLTLPKDDDGNSFLTVLAVVPDRALVGQFRRWADTEPKKADEILVKNGLLSHKDEVIADDGLFYGALDGLANLIPVRKAIVKNL